MSELFIGPTQAPQPEITPSQEMVDSYATALDKDPEEVQAMADAGLWEQVQTEALGRANYKANQTQGVKIQEVLTEQPEDALDRLNTIQEERPDYEFSSPDFATFMAGDPRYSKNDIRVAERSMFFERAVYDRLGKSAKGFPAGVGYFLDTAVSGVVQNILGAGSKVTTVGGETFEGAWQLVDLAQELKLLQVADIPTDEYKRRVNEVLDRVEEAGLFSDVNPYYLTTFLEMVHEGGVGPTSKLEQGFALLDITPLGLISRVGKTSARAGETMRNVAKVAGEDAAVSVVSRTKSADVVVEGTAPTIIAPGRSDTAFTAPHLAAKRQAEVDNTILNRVRNAFRGKGVLTREAFQKHYDTFKADTAARVASYKRHEMDIFVTQDDTGIVKGVAVLGRRGSSGGTKYATEAGAQKLATKIGGVVRKEPDGFVVLKEYNIPIAGLADPTDIKAVSNNMFQGVMSSMARTTSTLQGMLTQSEALGSKLTKELSAALTKASSGADWQRVDQIVKSLRDDPEVNFRTEPYTTGEFKSEYRKLTGQKPSDETIRYYRALQEANDVDYYFTADSILKRAIENGEEVLMYQGQEYRVRIGKPRPDDTVWVEAGTSGYARKFEDIETPYPVYEVQNAGIIKGNKNVQFITGPDLVTRRLYHSDVLPYNAGGHRAYKGLLKFFVKQDSGMINTIGRPFKGTPATFMGVRTREEAAKAMSEINTILKAIKDKDSNIDNLIRSNNTWNTSVEDLTSFKAFFDEHGLDLDTFVDFAEDGGKILSEDAPMWAGAETIGDTFVSRLTASQKGRGSRPLIGMGGETLETLDPSQAVTTGTARTLVKAANERYMFNAVNGWWNAAKAHNALEVIPDPKLPLRQQFEEAKIKKTHPLYQQFENERKTIQFRMGVLREEDLNFQAFMEDAAERMYGKGAKRLGKILDNLSDSDPVGKLRAFAFHTKLGMFNPDQLLVQSAQLINVLGIGIGSVGPAKTMQAMASVPAIRLALVGEGDNWVRTIARRQAVVTGINEDDFVQMVKFLKDSGRNIVDNTVVEENNTYATFGGKFKKFLDYGQVFFREGELAARLGAAALDTVERRTKYGDGVDIWTLDQYDAMFRRQDMLTASMTSASAAPWQRSVLSIPLQFMTYNLRMIEQLFVKDILSPKEKLSLGLTHIAFYGGAAFPFVGMALDRMHYNDPNAIENEGLRDIVRYGMLDQVLYSNLFGIETAFTTDLAIGDGLTDFFTSFATDPFYETIGGPSVGIVGNVVKDTFEAVGNVVTGNFDHTGHDWLKTARNISSVNKATNLYNAIRYGEYYAKATGQALDRNMTTPEVFALALGITTEEYDQAWATINIQQSRKKNFNRELKSLQEDVRLAKRSLRDGDSETFISIMDRANAKLQLMSISDRDKAIGIVFSRDVSLMEGLVSNALNNGQLELAMKLQEYIDGES